MAEPTRRQMLEGLAAGSIVSGSAGCSLLGPPCFDARDVDEAEDAAGETTLDLSEGVAWPTIHGDAASTRHTDAPGPVENVVRTTSVDRPLRRGPVADDGLLYGIGDALYALDPTTESVVWEYSSFEAGDGWDVTWPALASDRDLVVFRARDGLHGVDRTDGTRRWRDAGFSGSPYLWDPVVVTDDSAYASIVGGTDGRLRAVDFPTGRHWTVEGTGGLVGVADGTVFVSGPLRALDATDGTELWRASTREDRAATPRGAIRDGTVYVVVAGPVPGFVDAYDAADGTRLWTFQSEDGGALQQPAVTDSEVVVGSWINEVGGPRLHSLDRETGEQRWVVDFDCNVETVTVADDAVYVTVGAAVQARRLDDGHPLWFYARDRDCGTQVCAYDTPIVVDGALVVDSTAGGLQAFAER